MHASQGPFFPCPRRCAPAEGCKNEPRHAGISACISRSVLFFHLSQDCKKSCIWEVCTCRRPQKRTAARRYKRMPLGSVLHLSPEVCTCRRLPQRTAARRCKCMHPRVCSPPVPGGEHAGIRWYKCMHLGVRSSPVPGGVHLQKAANTNCSSVGIVYVQCISGSVLPPKLRKSRFGTWFSAESRSISARR